jgi:UDP-N-acetylglucosamine 2-epimerase
MKPVLKLLFCFGTRPEAIKLIPLVKECASRDVFDVKVCVTSQHREMLQQVLTLFEIVPDFDLDVMTPGQTLQQLTGRVIEAMTEVIAREQPDSIIVQGDTTTTFAVALAAFYQRIPVVHIEAGLRTGQKYAPFPEEMNRRMTSCLSDWHFAPTMGAQDALLAEGYPAERVFVVGNTVIDALLSVLPKVRARESTIHEQLPMIHLDRRMLLVTGHRRENFGQGFLSICQAIRSLAEANPQLEIVYPVHMNPNVQKPVLSLLSGLDNIHLISPQDYLAFVWLLDRCYLVLTDSGGVQEEAPSLGKPVLVMRETTERPEAVEAGVARLVGTDKVTIVQEVQRLLDHISVYQGMSRIQNPYGNGTSSFQIAEVLEKVLQ